MLIINSKNSKNLLLSWFLLHRCEFWNSIAESKGRKRSKEDLTSLLKWNSVLSCWKNTQH